jgi:hypothetical protein
MGAGRQLGTDRYSGREVQLAEESGRAGSLRRATPVSPSTLPSAVDPCCAARSLSPTTSSSPVVALSTRLTRLCLSCCPPCGLHSGACSCMPNSTTRLVPRACERQPLRPGIRNAATSAGPQARHAGGLRTSLGREEGRGSLTVQLTRGCVYLARDEVVWFDGVDGGVVLLPLNLAERRWQSSIVYDRCAGRC